VVAVWIAEGVEEGRGARVLLIESAHKLASVTSQRHEPESFAFDKRSELAERGDPNAVPGPLEPLTKRQEWLDIAGGANRAQREPERAC
jgi:hypothetical protein